MSTDLEKRLARLEAIQAVQQVKSRYLAACDAKDPETVRACFADGTVDIDYGAVGRFDTADALVELFTKLACHPHMLEMHHASNPRIEVLDEKSARANWALQYQCINTEQNTLSQLGGEYEDQYRLTEDGWKISATRFQVHSTLVLELGEHSIRKMLAARQPG